MGKLLCAAVLAVVLYGCAAGTRFEFDQARRVEVGMTEAEVTELMGPPYSVTTRGEDQIWVWTWVGPSFATKTVSFVFRDGQVQSVPKIPESFR